MANSQPQQTQVKPSNPPKPQEKPQKVDKLTQLENTVSSLMHQIRELTQRVRSLEEQMSVTRKKLDVFNQNMLATFQKDKELIERQNAKIRQFQKDILELQDLMQKLAKDIKNFARIDDVLRLEKYLDFWKPIKFVTYDGLERLVKKKVNEKVEDINLKLQIENYVKEQMKKAIIKFLYELKTGKIKIQIPEEDPEKEEQIKKEIKTDNKKVKKINPKNNSKKENKDNKKTPESDEQVVDIITGEPLI